MNKELERAFLQLENISYNNIEWQGQDNWIKLKDYKPFKLIKQVLTPPTEEEVCKIIQKQFNKFPEGAVYKCYYKKFQSKGFVVINDTNIVIAQYYMIDGYMISTVNLPLEIMRFITSFFMDVK